METTARPHRPRVRRALGPAGVAVLFVLLAGLVGMHGLGSHGVSGHSSTSHATSGSAGAGSTTSHARSGSSTAGHVAERAATHALAVEDPGPPVPAAIAGASAMLADHDAGRSAVAGPPPGPAGGHGALGLCLAVLVATVVGLLAARLSTSRGWRAGPPRLPLLRASAAAARRDRDPPSLAELCLLRC